MNKRITAHDESYSDYKKVSKFCRNSAVLRKLGQYEDLEEKNQINYRKILQCKNGTKVYVFNGGKIHEHIIVDLTFDYFLTNMNLECHCQFRLYFKKYGTYWALTREELEKKGSE